MRTLALLLVMTARGYAMDADWVLGKGVADVTAALAAGAFSAEALTQAYLGRIAALDTLTRAVLATNPDALSQARASDARRAEGRALGPLDGVPILVKDNIETADPMPTTAGSLALAANMTGRDAPVVAKLRAAGMVILGKTNLSEWANIRSGASISGWSAVGGQTRNPYALDRSPCGSSSGSGAAVAASLAPAAIGTETDGSITCPASLMGLVGIKPTVGLLSRTHIVPISATQDTPGPMTRTVADARTLLDAMAGPDDDDAATTERPPYVTTMTIARVPVDPAEREALLAEARAEAEERRNAFRARWSPREGKPLHGRKLAIPKFLGGYHAATDAVFERAVETLREAGAEIVEVNGGPDMDALGKAENMVLLTELKAGLGDYLTDAAPAVGVRSLGDVIAFNVAHADRELALFGQDSFEKAQAGSGLDGATYLAALADCGRIAGEALTKLLEGTGAEALIAPTGGPAWTIDTVNGDHFLGAASTLPAVARAPHVTVPMGMVAGLPVGLSFIGPRWSDHEMLSLAQAFEALMPGRPLPTFAASIDLTPERAGSLKP